MQGRPKRVWYRRGLLGKVTLTVSGGVVVEPHPKFMKSQAMKETTFLTNTNLIGFKDPKQLTSCKIGQEMRGGGSQSVQPACPSRLPETRRKSGSALIGSQM